jgi:hypothetical protein
MTLRSSYPGNFDNFGPQGRLDVLDFAVDALDARTANIPATPAGAAWSLGTDVVELIGEGAPDASAQAELDVNPTGDDNGLTFTAVAFGASGNAIAVAYVDPETEDAGLAVVVSGDDIVVSLATDENGAITSTAADVLAAVEASTAASALVTVAIDAGDTGDGDDGSGVVTAVAADNLADGAGVGVGIAGPGSRYTDVTNAKLYINGGTAAEPDWKIVTSA